MAPPRKVRDQEAKTVESPRPRNGNTYAVGAYLRKLRELRGLTREPMVRQIISESGGMITMSNSTMVQLEAGTSKSVGYPTIDAVRRMVGGDPYDISELSRLPIPAEDDDAAIKLARLEGEDRASARFKMGSNSSGGIQIDVRGSNDPNLHEVLVKVANDERLQSVVKQLANDPKALKIVLSFLKAET